MSHTSKDRTRSRRRPSRRAQSVLRNCVESLESRVLLSGHGVGHGGTPPGLLNHAAAPAQANASQHVQSDGDSQDARASASDSDNSHDDLTTDAAPVSSSQPSSPSDSDNDHHSPHVDPTPEITPPSEPADRPTEIEIVIVRQSPAPTDQAPRIGPNVEHPTNPLGGNEEVDVIEVTWQPAGHPVSVGVDGGSTDHAPHAPTPPTTGSDRPAKLEHDSEGSTPTQPDPPSARPFVLHPDRGGNNAQDNQPVAQPNVEHASPEPTGPTFLVVNVPIRNTSQAASAAPESSAVLTPLAQTPGHDPAGRANQDASRQSIAVVPVTASAAELLKPASPEGVTSGTPTVPQGFAMTGIAAVNPTAFFDGRAIAALGENVQAVAGEITAAAAIVANADVFASAAIRESAPATVAYNFIHFDAAAFQDAVASFANDLATLTTPKASHRSTARAWIVTASVLTLDALVLGYWYRKNKSQKRALRVPVRVRPKPHRPARDAWETMIQNADSTHHAD